METCVYQGRIEGGGGGRKETTGQIVGLHHL